MILSPDEFINFGLKMSVDEPTLLRALEDAELFYIKSVIGDTNYINYSTNTFTPDSMEYVILNGGIYDNHYYAGLKRAVANVAYAFLLRMNVNATRFGTVRKYDDNSSNVDETLLYNTTKHHFTIGKAYLKEVCYLLDGCDWSKANGCQFDEFNNLI